MLPALRNALLGAISSSDEPLALEDEDEESNAAVYCWFCGSLYHSTTLRTVLPSGVQYETLAAAQTARAGAGTTVGRGLSRGAQDMVLAHYCVRRVDGTVVSDSASVEDGRPLILAVRDLPPVRTTLPHDCSRRMQHGRRLDLPV